MCYAIFLFSHTRFTFPLQFFHKLLAFMQMFLSALIDVAGHAGKLDAAFGILHEARNRGIQVGTVSYSSLMGACSNVCLT